VLETLERATHVVFDKTGTLTLGHPVLAGLRSVGTLGDDECRGVAAALESANAHPLALALRDAHHGAVSEAGDLVYTVGQGVEGVVGGVRYRLGSAAFVAGLAGACPDDPGTARGSCAWLGSDDGWLARFEFVDGLRPEGADVVRRFQQSGKTVVLLSGDEPQAVRAVAAQLGIDMAEGGQLPEQKLDYVRKLQAGGAVVAMVGDGINDAAVLRGADVSFAVEGAAALAQLHADCVLLGDGLGPLADAAGTARRTLRVIRQNLAWATVYNLVAIPAAACGLLNPWLSGVGMAASSAIVVLNALRLRKD
jgi:Cu2+-exporting ATPase